MLPYFLGITIVFPIALALLFMLNKNGQIQRAAVILMTSALFLCAGWALIHGKDTYQPVGELSVVLENLFGVANVSVIIGMGYWNWRRKDWIQASLTLAQGILLGWFIRQSGGIGGGEPWRRAERSSGILTSRRA